ncbi:uncharacterized protein K02A2.6-like [Octopus sinensis]|uniref:Uncharacterized protein K02A2.6-like n=1 Tax=Octopus sinensis TaxID=2607531 RepID=A0A6P7SJ90_9MOLL|nr:uncharacterized protein K02A2.6-like [Octopus sinensis]
MCFQIKEHAIPVFKPKRMVSFAAIKHVNGELDRLEEIGVIQKVEHAKWAMVCIKKTNNKIRVCADFSTGLNECLKMCHYLLPTPEDIFAKLNRGKIFLKLDLSDAFLQIRVDEGCSKYLTVNTHKRLYKYNKLPFGLNFTSAIIQQVMNAMLTDCEFAIPYLDNILIKSESCDQHVEHVKCVLKNKRLLFHTERRKI